MQRGEAVGTWEENHANSHSFPLYTNTSAVLRGHKLASKAKMHPSYDSPPVRFRHAPSNNELPVACADHTHTHTHTHIQSVVVTTQIVSTYRASPFRE
jgi:hypothetical protein